MMADASQHVAWALVAAGVGTYLCRAMGVKLSGHIHQESEIFRWLSAVTYAMVAALTVRLVRSGTWTSRARRAIRRPAAAKMT